MKQDASFLNANERYPAYAGMPSTNCWDWLIIVIIIIKIYYDAALPVLSSALQYNNVILDSGH